MFYGKLSTKGCEMTIFLINVHILEILSTIHVYLLYAKILECDIKAFLFAFYSTLIL